MPPESAAGEAAWLGEEGHEGDDDANARKDHGSQLDGHALFQGPHFGPGSSLIRLQPGLDSLLKGVHPGGDTLLEGIHPGSGLLLEGVHASGDALLEGVHADRGPFFKGTQVGGGGNIFSDSAADHFDHGFGLGLFESGFFEALNGSVSVEKQGCQG